ncbi:DUF3810 domain-containing protein [Alloiococcus sp. CFN-8]|uniref:DUF3810 domain-containing protein n=1 Tax=Alloiococcus sp. CFN-8 TaxID=3416081 RepID=UPI003CEDB9A9
MRRENRVKLIIIGLVPVIYILNIILEGLPEIVEKYYSTTINKFIREALNMITGWLPFSLAELLYYFLVALLIWFVVTTVVGIFKKRFINRFVNLLCYLSILYILFMVLWGFNYQRQPLSDTLGYSSNSFITSDLYNLCDHLIERANILRAEQVEDEKGVTAVPGGYKEVFTRLQDSYKQAGKEYKVFSGHYGSAKAIAISPLMSYTGITGMYMPYTGEANVNYNIPPFMWASTAAHEMAHQRGFAREDEANYIAYLVCSFSEEEDIQYSGVFLALIYSMNAMYREDQESYYQLRDKYSQGLLRDMKYNSDFWDKYQGRAEEISNNINDSYLKGNRQEDGVKSYGRMVDLLLAEYRDNH